MNAGSNNLCTYFILMRKFFKIILLLSFLGLISCKKEKTGVQTVIKGHVSDNIRGINISGYKMVLEKSVYHSAGLWTSYTSYDEVATAYTDANGDYSMTFDYKLDYDGQSYNLSEQYYGTPYYPEYLQPIKIIAGNTNIVNINAWKPIGLILNVEVLNNIPSLNGLHVRNELVSNNTTLFNTENIYEQNIIKTYNLRSRPNSDIKIIFWYYTGTNPSPILHQKVFLYHTPLTDVMLNYKVDCSTF